MGCFGCGIPSRPVSPMSSFFDVNTGISLSEAFILGSTNPQYDRKLFIDLPVQYMKTTRSEQGENKLCTQIVLNVKTKTKNNFCAQHVLLMF